MNEFIITFREGLEATLIVGIIYTFLIKANMKQQIKQLWMGVYAAIAGSIIVAFLLKGINNSINNESVAKLTEGIFMFITAGLLLYVVFWLAKSISDRKKLEELAHKASDHKWGIFLLVFFAILREGFETVMFLFGSSLQSGFSYIGFSLGIILSCLIGYLIFKQGQKLNLKPFFATTSLFLVLFAAGMTAYGCHEIEEFVVKGNHLSQIGLETKDDIKRPWDILKPKKELNESDTQIFYAFNSQKQTYYHILHDKGTIGVFLKGFFGYNSNPNWIELIAWILTLLFGLKIWRQFYLSDVK